MVPRILLAFVGGVALVSFVPLPVVTLRSLAAFGAFFIVLGFRLPRAFVAAALCAGALRVAFIPLSFGILNPLVYLLESVRDAFVANISRALPGVEAAYLAGLLVGVRSTIPTSLREAFRVTGTSHLTALSGYNVTIIVQYLGALSRGLWVPLGGITLFVLATGAAPSLVRAAIMGTLVALAKHYGHLSSAGNALVAAVALMLLIDPTLLAHDIGFQLSVLATAGLIWLSPFVEQFFLRFTKKFKRIRESIAQTLAAQAATLPLVLFYFGSFSVLSPVVNVLVSLTIPLVMFFGFMTGIAGFVSRALSLVPAWPAFLLLRYQLSVIEFFASLYVF